MISHFNLVSAAFGKCCLLGCNFITCSHSKIISSENKDYNGIVVKSIHATIISAEKNLLNCHPIFFPPEVKNLGHQIQQWKSEFILTTGLRGWYSWQCVYQFIHVYVDCLPSILSNPRTNGCCFFQVEAHAAFSMTSVTLNGTCLLASSNLTVRPLMVGSVSSTFSCNGLVIFNQPTYNLWIQFKISLQMSLGKQAAFSEME